MLFLARVLHTLNGESLRNRVVDIVNGVVNDIYPFCNERHSMILLDDIYLSTVATLKKYDEINIISCPIKDKRLYAYIRSGTDELILLE